MEIQVWPARQYPFRAVVAGTWTVGIATVVFVWMGMWMGLFAFFLLVAWLSDFWFPWTIRLTSAGVEVVRHGKVRHLPWDRIARADLTSRGVFLVPRGTRRWEEPFRGIWIPVRSRALERMLEEHCHGAIRRLS